MPNSIQATEQHREYLQRSQGNWEEKKYFYFALSFNQPVYLDIVALFI